MQTNDIDAKALSKLLRVSVETARRRLAGWHGSPSGSAPATDLRPVPGRRGRSRYVTTRAELARAIPELDDE